MTKVQVIREYLGESATFNPLLNKYDAKKVADYFGIEVSCEGNFLIANTNHDRGIWLNKNTNNAYKLLITLAAYEMIV